MVKRLLTILVTVFIVSFYGCGGGGDGDNPPVDPTVYYTVTFSSQETGYTETRRVQEGDVIQLAAPEREGYTLGGWMNGTEIYAGYYKVLSSVDFQAKWLTDGDTRYEVVFKVNNIQYDNITVAANAIIYPPNKDKKTFYNYNSSFKIKTTDARDYKVTQDMTFLGVLCNEITSMSEITDITGNYILTKEIDGGVVKSIGTKSSPFMGVFCGGTFKNIVIDGEGLFANAQSAAILDVRIFDGTLSNLSGDPVGGIVGSGRDGTVVLASSFSGTVGGDGYAGGIVGRLAEGKIDECYFTGELTSVFDYAGGIAGSINDAIISNSYSEGEVTSGDSSAGGIVGNFIRDTTSTTSMIERSYSTATVSGKNNVGGIVGRAISGKTQKVLQVFLDRMILLT